MKCCYLSRKEAEAFTPSTGNGPFSVSLTDFHEFRPGGGHGAGRRRRHRTLPHLMGATDPAQAAEGTSGPNSPRTREKNAVLGSDARKRPPLKSGTFFSELEQEQLFGRLWPPSLFARQG
jgi:nucleoside diphosphate kinase